MNKIYIEIEEFIPILVDFCNYHQSNIKEMIEDFADGRFVFLSKKYPSSACLEELYSNWKNYIKDDFNQHCYHYEIINKKEIN